MRAVITHSNLPGNPEYPLGVEIAKVGRRTVATYWRDDGVIYARSDVPPSEAEEAISTLTRGSLGENLQTRVPHTRPEVEMVNDLEDLPIPGRSGLG